MTGLRWILPSEALPPYSESVVAAIRTPGGLTAVALAIRDKTDAEGEWWRYGTSYITGKLVVAWLPLPEPPP